MTHESCASCIYVCWFIQFADHFVFWIGRFLFNGQGLTGRPAVGAPEFDSLQHFSAGGEKQALC
jgi:hypothetical protein